MSKIFSYILLLISTLVLFQCGGPVLVSNPPSTHKPSVHNSSKPETKTAPVGQEVKRENEIDFSDAFDDSEATKDTVPTKKEIAQTEKINPKTLTSVRYPSFQIPTGKVRIALRQNISSLTLYSIGIIGFHGAKGDTLPWCRGKITITNENATSVNIEAAWGTEAIALPCTLFSRNDYNFLQVGDKSYRGAVILVKERPNDFTVVNYLDVEDYLRGVVPLEIGKRSESEIEALKAQAIAARAYTYKKIIRRQNQLFDMLSTVSDQVYGGADVEYHTSDLGVKLSRDLIMVYGDEVIDAYYHSTCGGKTANIVDVWEKTECFYLRSINDRDSSGNIYCKDSPLFKWEECWPRNQLSKIITKDYSDVYPGKMFEGSLKDIRVDKRFDCGRVKNCLLVSNNGKSFNTGGDKIRSVLRRNIKDQPILRSSRFTVEEADAKEIRLSGVGYGHGVGMCQMGAIGRAKAGQTFSQILSAYYSGIHIRTAVIGK